MPERKTFLLRLSPEVFEEIQRMASDELRSVNAQIEYLLRDALLRRGRLRGGRAGSSPQPGDEEEG
ncbi:MAG: Arc family DNA-binding protein [Armatimonadota bacterium]